MNKRGASIFVVFLFAMLLIAFAISLASPLNSAVQTVRTNSGCTTNFSTMDYGSQAVCTVSDIIPFLFTCVIIGIAGALIVIKLGGGF